jgi:methionine synthase I (cobalamin-dependent)
LGKAVDSVLFETFQELFNKKAAVALPETVKEAIEHLLGVHACARKFKVRDCTG